MSVQLYPGWNLVSLPVVPLSPVPKDVLAGLIANGTITTVWSYSGSPAPSWKYFDAKKGTGTLTSIMDGMGLWMFMTGPGVLNVEGYVILPAGFLRVREPGLSYRRSRACEVWLADNQTRSHTITKRELKHQNSTVVPNILSEPCRSS